MSLQRPSHRYLGKVISDSIVKRSASYPKKKFAQYLSGMIGGTVGEGAGQAGVLAEAEPPLLGEGHKQGGRPAARSARAFY